MLQLILRSVMVLLCPVLFFSSSTCMTKARHRRGQVGNVATDVMDRSFLHHRVEEAAISDTIDFGLNRLFCKTTSLHMLLGVALVRYTGQWRGALHSMDAEERALCNYGGGDKKKGLF
jgi:hypothetical protein